MTTTLCTRCGAAVESPQLHASWHEDYDMALSAMEARLTVLEAHQENLIERMHIIETAIDGGPEDVYERDEAEALAMAQRHSHGT